MSVATLEAIKQQAEFLTASEKAVLAQYLLAQSRPEPANETFDEEPDKIRRQKREAWLKANQEKYGGQYVALDGDILLGTGQNYAEAAQAARRAGVTKAYIDFVAPVGYSGSIGGW